MRLLIYGAGVIGSLYAVKFAEADHNVTIYARNRRLEELQQSGLRYIDKGIVKAANITVIGNLQADDIYDFIFLAVRADQIKTALQELRLNGSPSIVTMVNTVEDQKTWENICGEGRILPAFPGAGGGWKDGILEASLTPRIIQPTTFGELSGKKTQRTKQLSILFRSSGIPYQIVPNMHAWQLSHLGMVVPLADAYYLSDNPKNISQNREIMYQTAKVMRTNFRKMHRIGMLSPAKFHLVRLCPIWILAGILALVYRSKFAEVFMYQHAMKAPTEMHQLHEEYYKKMNTFI